MINKYSISKEQGLYAIENGDFASDVTASKDRVIVVMTQDWCPQWKDMKSWIYEIETDSDIGIYELIYNKTDFSKEFMSLKERKWENDQIPYLRYYKDGKIFKQTNYVSRKEFKKILE